MKLKLLTWSVIISGIFYSCSTNEQHSIVGFELNGESQGTTYTIIIAEETINVTKSEIDILLADFDTILSTYIATSEISKLNASSTEYCFKDVHHFFKSCYTQSAVVYAESNGAFDPSVFPLVKGWGFFKKMETPLSQSDVDSLLTFVSFKPGKLHSIEFKNDSVCLAKRDSRFMLDFNAIAQGYAVDILHDLLVKKGHSNFYVELGGELSVKGKNREGENWRIGIDTPEEVNKVADSRTISGVLSINNKAVATSGNYRNFYEKDGKKYAHTLNPITGFPVQHNVLSATVIADNCAIADAYATVFMVVGMDKAKEIIKRSQFSLDVVLIFENTKGELELFSTESAQKMLVD